MTEVKTVMLRAQTKHISVGVLLLLFLAYIPFLLSYHAAIRGNCSFQGSIILNDKIDSNTAPLLDPCDGKEYPLSLMKAAGMDDSITTDEYCQYLPYWPNYTALYGDRPVILGLERCSDYRKMIAEASTYPDVRIVGVYNTGTNALALNLERNLQQLGAAIKHDAPWGKHREVQFMLKARSAFINYTTILPLIIVREPLLWMQSMVRSVA
jgi:hypothetical protein